MCGVPIRSTVAVMCARSCLSGSGWHCVFSAVRVFLPPVRIDLKKKTNEKHRKTTHRPNMKVVPFVRDYSYSGL